MPRSKRAPSTIALRDYVDGKAIIRRIEKLRSELLGLDQVPGAPPLTKARFDAIKEALAVDFRLLNKTLPDLSAQKIEFDVRRLQDYSTEELQALLADATTADAPLLPPIDSTATPVQENRIVDDDDPMFH